MDHLPFCREQDIVFTKLPGGESNTVRKMCPRETGGDRGRRDWRTEDKEVLRGSTVTRPLPRVNYIPVSDYPHAQARIRLDRRNLAVSLFSRARIGKFKISPHGRRSWYTSPSDDTKSELSRVEAIPRPFLGEPIEFHRASSRHGTDSLVLAPADFAEEALSIGDEQ